MYSWVDNGLLASGIHPHGPPQSLWVSEAEVELGTGLGKASQGTPTWTLVENIVLRLHESQMKTSGFQGAKVFYSSIENK